MQLSENFNTFLVAVRALDSEDAFVGASGGESGEVKESDITDINEPI